jgi:hypothetical protein
MSKSSRNNQHNAQICTTALFYKLAATCFGSSLSSSGSFWIRLSYVKTQIDMAVYHLMWLSGLCVGVSWFSLLCYCRLDSLFRLVDQEVCFYGLKLTFCRVLRIQRGRKWTFLVERHAYVEYCVCASLGGRTENTHTHTHTHTNTNI